MKRGRFMKQMMRTLLTLVMVGSAFAANVNDDIRMHADKIRELDTNRVEGIVLGEDRGKGKLFVNVPENIPECYKKTLALVEKFNPQSKTNDHKRLSNEIDAYMDYLAKNPVIQYALNVTNTTIGDFRHNWFGNGMGFEHVIAGELKGSKVSGFHWWYRYYVDEKDGKTNYKYSMEGLDDPNIFTGSFTWDPDGKNGHLPNATKKKGGFTIGNTAIAQLAIGHIAYELRKKSGMNGYSFRFDANINGEEYRWQVYLQGDTIRSLYPMTLRKASKFEEIQERFDQLFE
jgi:hypothetical protein